jgi:hypothetical protein
MSMLKEASLDAGARLCIAYRLAAMTGVLMAVQAASGMLFFRLYRDQAFALAAWRVNDPMTLFVAVPVLFVSLVLALRGSLRGLLVLLGVMQYALYNYAFYLFGAALNVHFLLYVALFVVSGMTLITGLSALDAIADGWCISPQAPTRFVAAYMGIWALVLGVAWVGQTLLFSLTGKVPEIGEEPLRLIAALDLSLVVTPVAFSAAWLWARRRWGYVIAVVLNVKGAIYAAILAIASLTGGAAIDGGGDGLLGLWVLLMLGSLGSLVVLLASIRPVEK